VLLRPNVVGLVDAVRDIGQSSIGHSSELSSLFLRVFFVEPADDDCEVDVYKVTDQWDEQTASFYCREVSETEGCIRWTSPYFHTGVRVTSFDIHRNENDHFDVNLLPALSLLTANDSLALVHRCYEKYLIATSESVYPPQLIAEFEILTSVLTSQPTASNLIEVRGTSQHIEDVLSNDLNIHCSGIDDDVVLSLEVSDGEFSTVTSVSLENN